MKKLLALILALSMLFALSTTALATKNESEFSDIPTGWSRDAVIAAINNGLLNGDNGKVDPEGLLQRAQLAAVLVRAFGATKKADISAFKDVAADAWYYDELAAAVQMGIFEGEGNELRPEDYITRQEAALVLARAFKLTDTDADLSEFKDADEISPWALEGVAALVKSDYMNGDGSKLNPADNITRQELAQLMHNLVAVYVTEPGTVITSASGNVIVRAGGVTFDNVKISGTVIVGEGVGDGDVKLNNCTVDKGMVDRSGASISLSGNSKVSSVKLFGNNAKLYVGEDVTVMQVAAEATNLTVEGDGKVENVTAGEESSNVSISTPGTTVVNNSDASVKTPTGTVTSGTTGKIVGGSTVVDTGSSTTTYYKLSLTITDTTDTTKTLTKESSNAYITSGSSFYTEAISLITANRTALKDEFGDTAARALMEAGIAANETDGAWNAFVLSNFGNGADKIFVSNTNFNSRAVTIGAIQGSNTITYKNYQVVVNVTTR